MSMQFRHKTLCRAWVAREKVNCDFLDDLKNYVANKQEKTFFCVIFFVGKLDTNGSHNFERAESAFRQEADEDSDG